VIGTNEESLELVAEAFDAGAVEVIAGRDCPLFTMAAKTQESWSLKSPKDRLAEERV